MKKDKKKPLRISVSYQGTVPVRKGRLGTCRDDGMRLTLSIDGCADILAYAVVNFPEIDGRKVLVIHEIFSCQDEKTAEKILLEAAVDIAVQRGYTCVYADKGKTAERLLKRGGFQETDGNLLMKKVV